MFTGIVQEMGEVREAREGNLVIACRRVLRNTKLGDSVAINGLCLTIVEMDEGAFRVNLIGETYARSTMGDLKPGDAVNLEPAMQLGERLDGHLVQGHIDAVGTLVGREEPGSDLVLTFAAPESLLRYVVEKGSITVNGVSLTVVERSDSEFSVSIIPFTRQQTNLGDIAEGDRVNLEVDVLAKYVEQLLRPYAQRS